MVTAVIIIGVAIYVIGVVAVYFLSLFAGMILALGGMGPTQAGLLFVSLLWPIAVPWIGIAMIIQSARKRR